MDHGPSIDGFQIPDSRFGRIDSGMQGDQQSGINYQQDIEMPAHFHSCITCNIAPFYAVSSG